MGVRSISELLARFLNKEIPIEDYVYRRVPLNIFIQGRPVHRLQLVSQIFRNEEGGMSVDWERICEDPEITQTRDGRNADEFGVVGLCYFDVKKFTRKALMVISDQINYDCHCTFNGIPMSKKKLKERNRVLYDSLSNEEKSRLQSILLDIREHLKENAFWIIPIQHPNIKDPPPDFNYSEEFTDKIKRFFETRGHPIPT